MECQHVPTEFSTPTSKEIQQHQAAGLGRKRIKFPKDDDRFNFLATLHVEYPKLVEAGDNFVLYKAASGGAGSRLLEKIPPGPKNYTVHAFFFISTSNSESRVAGA